MIRKVQVIFCDNEHGTGDACFPDITALDRWQLQEKLIAGNDVRSVRREAKAAGWGRVNGGDYCPNCMASMED